MAKVILIIIFNVLTLIVVCIQMYVNNHTHRRLAEMNRELTVLEKLAKERGLQHMLAQNLADDANDKLDAIRDILNG